MSLKEINSPYKLIYWSYYNLVSSALGIPVDYVPVSSYQPEVLLSFDWNIIRPALAREFVVLEGVDASTQSKSMDFPLTSLAQTALDNLDKIRVSENQFVIDIAKLTEDFKPADTVMLINSLRMLMVLLFVLEVTQEEGYSVRIVNVDASIEKSKDLYYFKLFEYLPISYELSSRAVEVLNSLLYIDTCHFKGFFNSNLIERSKKHEYALELGLQKGAIVFLYKRNYVPDSALSITAKNRVSLVESVKLARIKKVTERGIDFEVYSVKESLEQLYWSFCQLSDEVQDMYISFSEYVKNSKFKQSEQILWDSLGVQYMMNNDSSYSEHYFVTRLESVHPVEVMTLDEDFRFESLSLSVVDAVYYLLLQYGLKFDRDLYKNMYNLKNAPIIEQAVEESSSRLEELLGYPVDAIFG